MYWLRTELEFHMRNKESRGKWTVFETFQVLSILNGHILSLICNAGTKYYVVLYYTVVYLYKCVYPHMYNSM